MGFIMTFGVALCNLYISFISLKNRAKVHIIKHITKIIFRHGVFVKALDVCCGRRM